MTKRLEGPETPYQRFRNFFLPFIYGIATANFVAVIQLVSAPQLTVDWKLLAAGDEAQVPRLIGFLGMVWMIASIPLLIGCALYHELTSLRRVPHPHKLKKPPVFFWILFLSLMGIPSTLFAFHPAFGISFILAFVLSAMGMTFAAKRFGRNDPTF